MQVAMGPRRRLATFRLGETVAHQTPSGMWYVWQTADGRHEAGGRVQRDLGWGWRIVQGV